MVGQLLGHYRLRDLVGHGGMGLVYRAEDLKLRRTVALKVLPIELSAHPVARERLIREACAASRLAHPNIATVYEVDEDGGQLFVAMEYVEGESLARRLARGAMALGDIIELGMQIADALATAHRAGVIHRDIKPGNVIIDTAGRAKVIDFGLALDVQRPGVETETNPSSGPTEATRLTRDGAAVGTVAYMSPEQARGDTPDSRTDIFSLGVLLYEMATGRLPFEGQTQLALAAAIMHERPVPMRDSGVDVSSGLREIVLHCLRKDPERRPPTADRVREALRLLGEGVTTGGLLRTLAPRPWVSRVSRWGAILALAVVAAAAGFLMSRVGGDDEPSIADAEARRTFERARLYELRGYGPSNRKLTETMYRKALELEPGNPRLQAQLAAFLANVEMDYPSGGDRHAEIRQLAAEALAETDIAQAWLARARLDLLAREPEAAIDSARRAIAAGEPASGGVMLGEALIDAGRSEEGLAELRRVVDGEDSHVFARARLARIFYDNGRVDEAAAEYRKVLDYAPDAAEALNNLGGIYLLRGNYIEAIGLLRRLLEIQPDDFAASNLGTAYFHLGRMDDAIEAYALAVKIAPERPVTKQNLAEAYEKAGDTAQARRWFEEALEAYDRYLPGLDPDLAASNLAERAFCAAKLSRFDEALENVRAALEQSPQDMFCLRSAARVHAMAGDRSAAFDHLGCALVAGYPGEDLRQDPTFQAYRDDPDFLDLLTDPEVARRRCDPSSSDL